MTQFSVTNLTTNESYQTELNTPLRPVNLLAVPYFSQLGPGADEHNSDCGSASGLMVLKAYKDVTMNVDQFYNQANTDPAHTKFDPLAINEIRSVLTVNGIMTEYKVPFEQQLLFQCLQEQKPVIALFKYATLRDANLTERKDFGGAHFAVIVGMDTKNVYVHDPYCTGGKGEARPYPLDIFWKAWIDVAHDPEWPNPERAGIYPLYGIGAGPEEKGGPALYKVKILQTLNVRSGPGVNFDPPIGQLPPNTVVTIFTEKNGWGEIASNQWIRLGPSYNVKVD
jgi:hypothetical protein